MPIIVAEKGTLRGTRYTLPERGVIRIGRDAACQVVVDDPMVSRVHCILRGRGGNWRVEDAGSRNHTFVNGGQIDSHVLEPGDTIELGGMVFSYLDRQDDPLCGRTLGGYRLEARIGRGGMGTVYLARQLSLDRQVALKVLLPALARDPAVVERFMLEARAAARLNHPNVVQVYDAGTEGEYHYFAMEYLPAGTLDDLIFREGRLEWRRAVSIALDALKALAYAEEQHVVHRDIKPGNLLFASGDTVKIGDLGIALDLGSAAMRGKSNVAGSPAFMAPEQAQGLDVDHRADIYALGATLYYAISGTRPFPGTTAQEVLAQKLSSDPVPLKDRDALLPLRLSAVVDRMMARKREDRYPSSSEAQAALTAALRTTSHAGTTKSAAAPQRRAARSKAAPPAVLAGVILIAVAAAVGIAHFATRERESPTPESLPAVVAADTPVPPKDPQPVPPRPPAPEIAPAPKTAPPAETALEPRDRKRLVRQIETAFQQDNLVEAARHIEAHARRYPAGPELDGFRDTLSQRLSALEEAAAADITHLCDEGEFTQARARVDAFRVRLPAGLAGRADALAERVESAEKLVTRGRRALEDLPAGVTAALARLDVAGAQELLNTFTTTWPELAASAAELATDLDAAAAVWKAVHAAIENAAAQKTACALEFTPDPLSLKAREQDDYHVLGLTARGILLRDAKKRMPVELRSIMEVAPARLADLASAAMPGEKTARGVWYLLLARCGPRAASEFLSTAPLPAEAAEAWRSRTAALGGAWFPARLRDAGAWLSELTADGGPPEAWGSLAREAATLLRACRADPALAAHVSSLSDTYRTSRTQELTQRPFEDLVHAKTAKRLAENTVHLSYDFADEAQAADFTAVGDTQWRLVPGRRILELTGELRFLAGVPFRDYMMVSARVVNAVREAPNVNLAFWTAPEDKVRLPLAEFSRSQWDGSIRSKTRAEYLVVGMGYRYGFDPANPNPTPPLHQRLSGFIPLFMRDTVLVLQGCRHGTPAGQSASQLLWETPAEALVRPPFAFSFELNRGVPRWRIGGRAITPRKAPDLSRLPDELSHQGSFSLFTNECTIHLTDLTVAATLRPEWVAEEGKHRAQRELKTIIPPP